MANLTASAPSGTAPFDVTFALTGSDVDGDPLNWTLAYGDGTNATGAGLPATPAHRFAAAGNFTVTLVVTDGHANTTRSLLVTATAAATGSAPGMDPACQRPDAIDTSAGYYVDDRGNPALGILDNSGTWIYKEANGIPGLQLTQEHGTAPAPLGGDGDVDPLAVANHCLGGDELVF